MTNEILYLGDIISRQDAIAIGAKLYFNKTPCKFGHIEQRNVKTCVCLECAKISRIKHLDCNPFARQDAAEKYRRSTKGKAAQARASAKYRRRLRNERDDDSLQL